MDALTEPFRRLPPEAPPHWLVDCTLGGGGHTQAFLAALAAEPALRRHRVLAVDQDSAAVARGRERFARELAEGRLEILHAHFGELAPALQNRPVLGLLADLGFSSDQLEDESRGLSFQGDGPLDMRLDPTRGWTARDFLAQNSESEIEKVLREYGEERFSKRIASAIVRSRRETHAPRTTRELAELVTRSVPPPARHGRIHAATRTFQALRIAVNGELEELDSLLNNVILSVVPGGRVAILSFHSLEDRKVKFAFKKDPFEPLTKKPLEADEAELQANPRARSAKLRIAER
ncbi:MAG: 16S rRNA (cytosine(1402)-N(4))-methyltransferase RsmH, partial [Bdellovibrionota bacterium]